MTESTRSTAKLVAEARGARATRGAEVSRQDGSGQGAARLPTEPDGNRAGTLDLHSLLLGGWTRVRARATATARCAADSTRRWRGSCGKRTSRQSAASPPERWRRSTTATSARPRGLRWRRGDCARKSPAAGRGGGRGHGAARREGRGRHLGPAAADGGHAAVLDELREHRGCRRRHGEGQGARREPDLGAFRRLRLGPHGSDPGSAGRRVRGQAAEAAHRRESRQRARRIHLESGELSRSGGGEALLRGPVRLDVRGVERVRRAQRGIRNADKTNGGLSGLPAPEVPPNSGVSFTVEDLDAAADKVRSSGGQVLVGPEPMGSIGCFLVAVDPQGGTFGLYEGEVDP